MPGAFSRAASLPCDHTARRPASSAPFASVPRTWIRESVSDATPRANPVPPAGPRLLPTLVVAALASWPLAAVWASPDLEGPRGALSAAACACTVGLAHVALGRLAWFRRRRWPAVLLWSAAYAGSMWLFPMALTGSSGFGEDSEPQPLVGRVFQYALLATPSRVVAYPLMLLALLPVVTASIVAICAAVALYALVRLPPGPKGRTVLGAGIASVSISTGIFYAFKLGPPEWVCARLEPVPGLRQVAANALWRSTPGLEDGGVYDVQPVGENLVASIKIGAGHFGAFALIDRESGQLRDLVSVRAAFADSAPPPAAPLFPERMTVRGNQVFALLLGSGNWLASAAVEAGHLVVERAVPLPAEGTAVLADPASDRAWVVLAAATGRGILEYRGDPPVLARHSTDEKLEVGFQYAALSDGGDRLVVSAYYPSGLYVVDTASLAYVGSTFGSTLVGIAFGPESKRIFASDPLRRRLVAFDAASLEPAGAVPIHTTGLADVQVDPGTGSVVLGSYDGSLRRYAASDLAERGHAWTGWMLRNITVDRARHEALVASGCGIFAWDLTH